MAKRKQEMTFGDPLNWTTEPRKILHPQGCRCVSCEASIKWAQGYQKYIRRVDR